MLPFRSILDWFAPHSIVGQPDKQTDRWMDATKQIISPAAQSIKLASAYEDLIIQYTKQSHVKLAVLF